MSVIKEIRNNKFLNKAHGLNPENMRIGDGSGVQGYLKSLLPQV
jgi:hypothetical protein